MTLLWLIVWLFNSEPAVWTMHGPGSWAIALFVCAFIDLVFVAPYAVLS